MKENFQFPTTLEKGGLPEEEETFLTPLTSTEIFYY